MIEFFVSGQSLKFFTPVVAADSLNYLTAKVNFNEEWEGYSKWLHFRQGENLDATVYDINLDENDEVTADDALNLGIGEWEIYVTGTKDSSRITTETVILTVKESGLIDAPLHGLPMSVAEQVDFKANQALLVAMSVKEAADSGKFDGKSFAIKGYYNSAEELEAVQENPAPGDIYGVGTGEPYDLYIWDGVGSAWVNNGKLQGAKGDDGAQGVTFTPNVESNGNLSWTNDGGLKNPATVNIMGAKGGKGDKGDDGKSPYQAACEAGYTGTEQTFNMALTSFPYHNVRHLPDGADPITVKTGNIEDSAVTAAKIANGAVTRAKLAHDALYSPLDYTAATERIRKITVNDIGKTLFFHWTSDESSIDTTFSLSQEDSSKIPDGGEIALCYYHGKSCSISFTGGMLVDIAGEGRGYNRTIKIPEKYGMVGLKKMFTSNGADCWLVTGNVEVVT